MAENRITRRDFVRDGAISAAGVAAAGMTACQRLRQPPATIPEFRENMEYRPLGSTGLRVSAISLGGHWKKIPYKPGTEDFAKNRRDVVSACIDHGINYVDACTGGEVMAYAEALRGRRDRMYMGYSWYEHEMRKKDWQTARKLLEGFDDGLRKAKLDYVDLWRITCYWQPQTNHTLAHEEAICEALETARKAGKTRHCGISTHKHDWAIRMMETYPKTIEVVVVPYTAGSKSAHARVDPGGEAGWHAVPDTDTQQVGTVSLIEAARKNRAGWLGIKPFASGSIFRSRGAPDSPTEDEDDERARQTLRYVLSNASLSSAMPGMITVDQVKNAARAVTERRQFDTAEAHRFERAVEEMWANLPRHYEWLRDWEYV